MRTKEVYDLKVWGGSSWKEAFAFPESGVWWGAGLGGA